MRMWVFWVLVTLVKIVTAVVLAVGVLGWPALVVGLGLAAFSSVLAVLDWRKARTRKAATAAASELTAPMRPVTPQQAPGSLFDTGSMYRVSRTRESSGRVWPPSADRTS